jgi:hypothetical protein
MRRFWPRYWRQISHRRETLHQNRALVALWRLLTRPVLETARQSSASETSQNCEWSCCSSSCSSAITRLLPLERAAGCAFLKRSSATAPLGSGLPADKLIRAEEKKNKTSAPTFPGPAADTRAYVVQQRARRPCPLRRRSFMTVFVGFASVLAGVPNPH